MTRGLLTAAGICWIFCGTARANDAAAETVAGGIVLKEERRVSMRKERLRISEVAGKYKVSVEYEFVNESKDDVTTEIAFPVPPYTFMFDDVGGPRNLGKFRAWVNGKAIPVERQLRAVVNGKDYALLLRQLGINIEDHGGCDMARGDDFTGLSARQLKRLKQLGVVEDASYACGVEAKWAVDITWHWTQHFPPGKVVRIRHEYTPSVGFQGLYLGEGVPADLPADACFDPAVMKSLVDPVDGCHVESWVKYILTTANTWKTPISDFELLVEHPANRHVSFCWDGKVEAINATTARAAAKDFVPKHELTVYFF